MPETLDIEELMYTDPKKALRIHREIIKAELRAEYQQSQGQKEFWAVFYNDYPELKADHDQVTLALQENWKDLADLPVSQANGTWEFWV